uniref:Uncharacterized protein n=1 Tax=Kalanchoe fedtschenkoi TaxID=63787 RepID=A0A7N1A6S0_KALFE
MAADQGALSAILFRLICLNRHFRQAHHREAKHHSDSFVTTWVIFVTSVVFINVFPTSISYV